MGVEGSRIGWGSKGEKDGQNGIGGQLTSRTWMDVGDLQFGRTMVCKEILCSELQHASSLTGLIRSWEVMNSTGIMPVETRVGLRKDKRPRSQVEIQLIANQLDTKYQEPKHA